MTKLLAGAICGLCSAAVAETVTVGFLGGSITEMNGFRPRVMKALQEKYPDIEFKEIAAGLASTCSDTGAFRMEQDLLSHGMPDLFICEAAVNDDQDGHFSREHSIRGMEGIVRHMLMVNPRCAVVVGLMVNKSQYDQLMKGETPRHYVAHTEVAKHYGAAIADVGSALVESAKNGGISWNEYRDCHPSPAGCDLGAEVVMKAIDGVFDPTRSRDAIKLPPPIDELSYFHGRFLQFAKVKCGKGWQVSHPDWQSIPGSKREYFIQGDALWTETPGSELEFSFNGTACGALLTVGPDAGDLEVSVDGSEWRKIGLRGGGQLHYPYTQMFADDLKTGPHLVKLRSVEAGRGAVTGHAIRITRLAICGSGI